MSAEVLVAVLAALAAALAVKMLTNKCADIRGSITIVLAPTFPCCPAEEAAIMRARILLSDPR
jgi:hypothetical protein